MNVFTRVTWKSMLKNRTRTLVTVVGVILSAALFTAVITTVVSAMKERQTLKKQQNAYKKKLKVITYSTKLR